MSVVAPGAASRLQSPPALDSPSVSVIIPVRNGAHHLARTLPVLRAELPAGWEVLVVDDHSTDGSFETAQPFADRVLLSQHAKSGPAARNTGARAALAKTLVFLDADIRVTRAGLEQLVEGLKQPGVACAFGVYSEGRYLRTLGGRFKNVWVRYSYLKSPMSVRWMNTAMSAIRKADFWAVGGYDVEDDWLQGGNDMDFGRVVAENVGPVILLRHVECDHLKEMSLWGLLRNDYNRTRGYFRLSLQSREIKRVAGGGWFGNISPTFMGGVVAAACVPLGLGIALIWPSLGLRVAAGAAVAHAGLAAGFYGYALPRLGWWAPLAPVVFLLDHLACGLGLAVETATRLAPRPGVAPGMETASRLAARPGVAPGMEQARRAGRRERRADSVPPAGA